MPQHFMKPSGLSLATMLILSCGAAQAQQAQGDPLYRYQWYLMNYGQSVLGDTRPAFGADLGIDDLHSYNIRGRGVVVSVVDEGTEIAHPDLAANMVPNGSWNFNNNSHDPTPVNAGAAHGTAVSGIIAAVGWNGIGVRGVAPSARLKSFNFLETANQDAALTYSWWDGPESRDVAVSNNSWGPGLPVFSTPISENEIAAFERPMSATRGGLGTVYVKAAGNGFQSVSYFGLQLCTEAGRRVGCAQTLFDTNANWFNVITVAAVNAAGRRSSYSTPGAGIWVSGLGGEYGWQAQTLLDEGITPEVVARQLAERFDPAIVTADLSGCARGYNINPDTSQGQVSFNALDSDRSSLDNTCNYTGRMNGTSAAAPTVAGTVALMLQVNPKLSYRDVKYILATTSRRIDPGQAPVIHPDGTVIAPGWMVNAAGRAFSSWYGFGLVDATLAVTRAGSFRGLGPLIDSGWTNSPLQSRLPIGNAAAPARARVSIPNGASRIEAIQIGLATDYPGADDGSTPLLVSLISPSGTRAVVLPAGALSYDDTLNIDFAVVNAFLDERGGGDWTVEVADTSLAAGTDPRGHITSFKIRVLGH